MTTPSADTRFRVLVVDDSAFMRKAIRSALERDPEIDVVGNARDGNAAVKLAAELRPDLITMDVEMPGMDGLTALRRIMRESPTRVVMVSSLTTEGSQHALTALKLGAVDAVAKHQNGEHAGAGSTADELLALIAAIRAHDEPAAAPAPARAPAEDHHTPRQHAQPPDVVCIGSSTGGPPILEQLICAVPKSFKPAVVIAQHMPELFTRSMAARFDELCQRPVVHIEDGQAITPGTIHICPGGTNTHLAHGGGSVVARLSRKPDETIYFPSVNVLFDTAASIFADRTLAFVLTGMGDDGAQGARSLVDAGATIYAQSAETCTIYGMPKAVVDQHLATAALSPTQLAQALANASGGGARRAA